MNVVGELALVRSAVNRIVDRFKGESMHRQSLMDLDRIGRGFERQLSELRTGILDVRMVPLGQVFNKLARIVRQAAREHDKEVRLVVTGANTEVDKLIVEELTDPLMHLVRNAIDHGIEPADARTRVAKPPAGTLALNAYHKGSNVVIEVEDDGGGMNAHKLREAAVARGILSADISQELTRQEMLNLVFLPGLSTSSEITDLSGRGVGMDVVKTNILRMGGMISIASENGIGTKITVTLPITLAIIRALIVTVASMCRKMCARFKAVKSSPCAERRWRFAILLACSDSATPAGGRAGSWSSVRWGTESSDLSSTGLSVRKT
jgi:two-component system chemotaxis sensor kinase CheA